MAFARWGAELVFARWDTVFDFNFHYRQFCYAGFHVERGTWSVAHGLF